VAGAVGKTKDTGPFGIATHLPMPVGMPTYAGTSVTAGGLLFFAGSQDFYLRAYDAQTGEEVWKHPLPVGSGAMPMTYVTYVSPRTGRQYVVVSVGGAARSPKTGDYFSVEPISNRKQQDCPVVIPAKAGIHGHYLVEYQRP
jgi:quinate dehydrogenase (quinone)